MHTSLDPRPKPNTSVYCFQYTAIDTRTSGDETIMHTYLAIGMASELNWTEILSNRKEVVYKR